MTKTTFIVIARSLFYPVIARSESDVAISAFLCSLDLLRSQGEAKASPLHV